MAGWSTRATRPMRHTQEIRLAVWNCNGSLWTHPGRLDEVMAGHDLIMITETHQSPEKGLPRVEAHQWESVFRGNTRQSTSRGSGGVALLFRQGLHDCIRVVSRSTDATHMWIRLQLTEERAIYMALCYFAPKGSDYATQPTHGEEQMEIATRQRHTAESPYSGLSEDILQFSSLGEVFLLGDFNERTQSTQCEYFNFEQPEILHNRGDSHSTTLNRYGP
eukprot:c25408_g3_i1 orf=461-1120(-)